ncbi:hypothetical protein KBB96_12715 [Luteolibacter ambystomatis]|uniref:Uncharacterized protein n=1 Tax=Luteolibacter ambystomatis TaxID=2824561 RepID=A0A975G6J3_9BACT|nr:hypothetical protein [Luteolibacter ambystomatis]QUE49732.1 hypothetical protein KBB96_12715 [Luteolibacter ambystomatis]
MEPNPYLPPTAAPAPADAGLSSDEQLRRQCIKRESTLKSLGGLQIIGGVFLIVGILSALSRGPGQGPDNPVMAGTAVILPLALLSLVNGVGLYKLMPWARIVGTVLSCLGLLGFPIGTLINALILGAYWSKPSDLIFSADYKRIVAATPHVKMKTSKVMIVMLVIFGVVVLALAGLFIVGSLIR